MGLLFRLFAALAAIVFGVEVVVIGGMRQPDHNPLARYRQIMPGKTIEAVQDFPCQMHMGMSKGVEVGLCQFEAEDGVIGRVTVVAADQLITRLSFEVQPDALRLGDLVLCWGEPDIPAFTLYPDISSPLNLRWGSQIYAAISAPSVTSLSYFIPISYLSFERGALPCTSGE
jgi:hypothetical protein